MKIVLTKLLSDQDMFNLILVRSKYLEHKSCQIKISLTKILSDQNTFNIILVRLK